MWRNVDAKAVLCVRQRNKKTNKTDAITASTAGKPDFEAVWSQTEQKIHKDKRRAVFLSDEYIFLNIATKLRESKVKGNVMSNRLSFMRTRAESTRECV